SAEIRVTSPKTGEKTVFNEPMTKFVPKTININVEPGDELKFFLRLVGENIVTAHTSASKALIEKGSCRNTGI
ncbi:MAG: hypothetical protein NTV34_15535, partial [Proteobacteria bacterium]|nr:hypothetical protein [Pseudomonadota bacterium]